MRELLEGRHGEPKRRRENKKEVVSERETFMQRLRDTDSPFVVKSKLVTVLSLSLFTFLQLPPAASVILGLNYARCDSRVVT